MGYPLHRFNQIPNKECVVCALCGNVLRDPLNYKDPECQHNFCQVCLGEELKKTNPKCPLDGTELTYGQIALPPRLLSNLLSELRIKCENEQYGCQSFFALHEIESHLCVCSYDPEKEIDCGMCGGKGKRQYFKDHDCFEELKLQIELLEKQLKEKEELIKSLKRRTAKKREQLSNLSTNLLESLENLQNAVKNPDTTPQWRKFCDCTLVLIIMTYIVYVIMAIFF